MGRMCESDAFGPHVETVQAGNDGTDNEGNSVHS